MGKVTLPKAKKPKIQKEEPSEAVLVERYAKAIIGAARSTMVDRKDLHGILGNHGDEVKKTATMLALDRDFYFTVCFQTSDQKYEFLQFLVERFGIKLDVESDEAVEILNGLTLADSMGCKLKLEEPVKFPKPDEDLLPFVLDNEI